MEIKEPYINIRHKTKGKYFDLFKFYLIWNSFVEEYNSSVPLSKKIKQGNYDLYFCLVLNCEKYFNETPNKSLDNNEWVLLTTNRKTIQEQSAIFGFKKPTRNITNYIKRLEEAGALKTGNFNGAKNIELFINPELLLINDKSNQSFIPTSKYLPENLTIDNISEDSYEDFRWKILFPSSLE